MMKKIVLSLSVIFGLSANAKGDGLLSVPLSPLFEGEDKTLADYKGKVVLLDAWASWATPSRESFPFYQDLENKYGKEGFVVVSVNNEQDVDAAKKFYQSTGVAFDAVRDPNNDLLKQLDPGDMPTAYLLDRSGKVTKTFTGFKKGDEANIEEEVKKLVVKDDDKDSTDKEEGSKQ
jgi:thiol-disulfide isomerase/thioredoxin